MKGITKIGKKPITKKRLRKICRDCYNWYNPEGKFQRYCPECMEKRLGYKR